MDGIVLWGILVWAVLFLATFITPIFIQRIFMGKCAEGKKHKVRGVGMGDASTGPFMVYGCKHCDKGYITPSEWEKVVQKVLNVVGAMFFIGLFIVKLIQILN